MRAAIVRFLLYSPHQLKQSPTRKRLIIQMSY